MLDRDALLRCVDDSSLGLPHIRDYHRYYDGFRTGDPSLTLDTMVRAYWGVPHPSMIKLPFMQLIFGQSYRAADYDFVRAWARTATDAELRTISWRFMLGVLLGMEQAGLADAARELFCRLDPRLSPLDRENYLLIRLRLGLIETTSARGPDVIARLRSKLSALGPEWDWLCDVYPQKLATAQRNLTDIRVDQVQVAELQEIILRALVDRRPLALQRVGDGAAYGLPLPTVASARRDHLAQDDAIRELHWWGGPVDAETRQLMQKRTMSAIREADVLGVVSAYRIARDVSPEMAFGGYQTGRALLAHVEALGTSWPLHDKVVTEDRVHTIIFDDVWLKRLLEAAADVLVVGGLAPSDMRVIDRVGAGYVAITPQANNHFAIYDNALSLTNAYDAVEAKVVARSGPGVLVLVSGGYAGKALVAAARRAGSVALDIGSLADRLAGRHTRSPSDAF